MKVVNEKGIKCAPLMNNEIMVDEIWTLKNSLPPFYKLNFDNIERYMCIYEIKIHSWDNNT